MNNYIWSKADNDSVGQSPGAGPCTTAMSVRFGSLADTQSAEKCQLANFGTGDASVSVCFRPKADIGRNPGFAGRAESVTDFFVGCYLEDLGLVGVVHPYYVSATYTIH